jgi:hypothetical protein
MFTQIFNFPACMQKNSPVKSGNFEINCGNLQVKGVPLKV